MPVPPALQSGRQVGFGQPQFGPPPAGTPGAPPSEDEQQKQMMQRMMQFQAQSNLFHPGTYQPGQTVLGR